MSFTELSLVIPSFLVSLNLQQLLVCVFKQLVQTLTIYAFNIDV